MALLFLAGALACGNAWARPGGGHHGHGGWHGAGHGHWHGRSHVGVVIGAPLGWGGGGYRYGPGWYGDPFDDYPYPRPLVVREPPVYIERGGEPSAQLWYYCAHPQGYYPYVKTCATAWRSVVPSTVLR
ncbi:hypothetical protein [Janthinobacterium agaricidamnosum]|uniref:Lipoprotein n=1 Tax=Janthinobacterium agaricidamnosum NBRC 102515 = DSM 9628 TaxID=1349767 RepID=W0VAL5_9BURK|nr:hypothetical protein [Janthinobacterium agaricidamnosum]CDG84635.1 putative uncharacterized protein [Janthinobacterium agaricidamnosum NBRC 102515 = DSM 9628]